VTAPYVDFAVWGPFGCRSVKKHKCLGQMFNNAGVLVQLEIPGPATFNMWQASYNVFTNAMLLLNAADPVVLRSYQRHHERFYDRFGALSWAIQYQAHVRTFTELFGRIYREALASYEEARSKHTGGDFQHPLDPARPWNHVLDYVVSDANEINRWWEQQMEKPAMMLINGTAQMRDLVGGDAPVHLRAPPLAPPGVENTWVPDISGAGAAQPVPTPVGQRPPKRRATAQQPERAVRQKVHNVEGGVYTTSRSNYPLCSYFQQGKCQASVRGQFCPVFQDTMHLCNKCLSNEHGGDACTKTEISTPNWVHKGKGKGQKKGKGGGKPSGKRSWAHQS